MSRLSQSDKLWVCLITLGAFLIRLPYWDVIPASFDEVNQTAYAFLIARGESLPLVGNDAYAGPFYFYVLAGLLRMGIADPMVGRAVVMVTGTATAPLTYAWAKALGKSRDAGLIAAGFVALNPDLILVNSHIGGTTFLLPFFSTLFLLGLTLSVRHENWQWVLLAGMAGGLALQSNPVAALLICGGLLWFLWETYRGSDERMQSMLRLAGLLCVVLLVYSPVIIHNLTTDFQTADALQQRAYLWQDSPTVATTFTNLRRLSLQLVRQFSGVLRGDEGLRTLVGTPLLYVVLMAVGLGYTSIRVSSLPVLALAPFLIIVPVFSHHYGFVSIGRFTTLLIPVWATAAAHLLAGAIEFGQRINGLRRRGYTAALLALALVLSVHPVRALFCYYRSVNEARASGRALLEISRHVVAENEDEPVYISTIDELSFLTGIPYVPHAAFLLADIHHEFLVPQQILSRLYEDSGPAYMLLSDHDAGIIEDVVQLRRVAISANQEAGTRGYGLYHLERAVLPTPDFVLPEEAVPEDLSPVVTFEEGIQLRGCEVPEVAPVGGRLSMQCYWTAIRPVPPGTYVNFVYLLDPANSTLVSQDDHLIGHETYPPSAWRPGEVIREEYVVEIPDGSVPANYRLTTGIYTWPSQTRLRLQDSADDCVILPPVRIGAVPTP